MHKIEDLMVANIFKQCSDFANEIGAVNLAQGVPEPIMDQEINRQLPLSFSKGWQYADPHGLVSLRTAIANLFAHHFSIEQILVTSGCTESLYLALFAATQTHGTKAAFLEPFYPYYMQLSKLLNLEATPIRMVMQNFKIVPDWDAIEQSFIMGVKIFLLNTPHNPAGYLMSKEDAVILRNLADKYGVFLIVDYAYQYYVYNGEDDSSLKVLYEHNNKILIAGSASKLLSATGLRIGWLIGDLEPIKVAYALHLYMSYCQPAPLQELVATLLKQCDKTWSIQIQQLYRQKRDCLFNALKPTNLKCYTVSGGHFLLADYTHLNNNLSSSEFAKEFANKYGVMPLPVEPFYHNKPVQQIRLSFSVSLDLIEEAASRISS